MTHKRRGISLIELVIVMGVLSVVMTLVGKTLALLMRSERAGRNAVVAASGITRLANRFRRDVHAAEKVELVAVKNAGILEIPGFSTLRLTHPDGTIVEYRAAPEGVKVTTVRGAKQTGRETYRLQGATRFEMTDGPPPLVTLIHVPDHGRIAGAKTGAKNDKQLRVEAVRGFDRRFAGRSARSVDFNPRD